jgi:hypothetical protein
MGQATTQTHRDNRFVSYEVRDVAPGIWIWRVEHPSWSPASSWKPAVTSTYVEARGEVLVLDALAPPEDAREVWERLNARPPSVAVVLKPDHVRDVDFFVERYACRAFGPWLFFRGDAPKTELEDLEPGIELPGGPIALYDGRYRMETPLWLPEQRALVFADALTERDGQLLVWGSRGHEQRVVPALRKMLELPFEHVIVSHGEPLHDRRAFERALELPPFEE